VKSLHSSGNGILHFVDEKAKVNSAYYVGCLLPNLVEDCIRLLPTRFIFQQHNAPAQKAHFTQDWIQTNCPHFIAKDQWPPNSPDLNGGLPRLGGNARALSHV